ncbi:MAG: SDR family oxidoreductase [Planctomycetes bacterium]|nr:SDR family oxidoreductase [Planctomycetota bacterium]
MQLADKVVLVTGGGSGIGLGIAEAFAQEGCRVAITGRSESRLMHAAESVAADTPVLWKACDVSDRQSVRELFDWLTQELGSPDILVNSAGINVANRLFENIDPDDFDYVLAVNVTGSFNCIHAALPAMRQKGDGVIINIVSISGLHASILGGLPYSISKFGQSALGLFANLELAEQGIRVTNIYPGEANTPILDKRPAPPPEEKRAAMLQPEDIAACAVCVAKLPPRAVVPQLVIVPPYMVYG